jgi:hypothetical protein
VSLAFPSGSVFNSRIYSDLEGHTLEASRRYTEKLKLEWDFKTVLSVEDPDHSLLIAELTPKKAGG